MSRCNINWPQSVECSSNGECKESLCHCSEGFIGIGDFAVIHGIDCDIHVLTIRVLYSLAIIISLLPIFFTLRYFYQRQISIRLELTQKKIVPLNFMPILASMSSISFIFFALMKVTNPEYYVVGRSFASTLFFGISYETGWCSQLLYLYVFCDLVIRQARIKSEEIGERILAQLWLIKKFLISLAIINIIWGFVPLVIIINPSSVNIIGAIHYLGASFNFLFAVFIVLPRTLIPMSHEIGNALKDLEYMANNSSENFSFNSKTEGMKNAQKKLLFLISFLKRTSFQELCLACIFGLWPFFLHKATYQLSFTYLVAQIVFSFEIHSISNFATVQTGLSSPTSPTISRKIRDENDEKETSNQNEPQTVVTNYQYE